MQIIVQEGNALVSLLTPVQSLDENLRTTMLQTLSGHVKVYYRDFEVVKIEARDGSLEVLPAAVAGITWLEKERRYQLKIGS